MDVQDAGEREAAEPGADDRDVSGHGAFFLITDRWADTRQVTPGAPFH
ncbi:hypothetical protein [Streptomyces sp. NPDC088146]